MYYMKIKLFGGVGHWKLSVEGDCQFWHKKPPAGGFFGVVLGCVEAVEAVGAIGWRWWRLESDFENNG